MKKLKKNNMIKIHQFQNNNHIYKIYKCIDYFKFYQRNRKKGKNYSGFYLINNKSLK